MPRHLTTVTWARAALLRNTYGQCPFFRVKVLWTDFVTFGLILHFLKQIWLKVSRCSIYVIMIRYNTLWIVEDLMCTMCRAHFPAALLTGFQLCQWLRFYVSPQNVYYLDTILRGSIYLKETFVEVWRSCQTLSNAWLTSMKTAVQYSPLSIEFLAIEYTLLTCSIVEWYFLNPNWRSGMIFFVE